MNASCAGKRVRYRACLTRLQQFARHDRNAERSNAFNKLSACGDVAGFEMTREFFAGHAVVQLFNSGDGALD